MAPPSCQTNDDTPLNVRRSQGGHPKKSVHHTLTSGIPSMLRGVARRAELGEVDVTDLADLRALHDHIEAAMADTIAVLRRDGYSWGDIGRALGTTRQSAQMTYGR